LGFAFVLIQSMAAIIHESVATLSWIGIRCS
jgi:hypothetical protein